MFQSIQPFVPPEPLRIAFWQLVPGPKTNTVPQEKPCSTYPSLLPHIYISDERLIRFLLVCSTFQVDYLVFAKTSWKGKMFLEVNFTLRAGERSIDSKNKQ